LKTGGTKTKICSKNVTKVEAESFPGFKTVTNFGPAAEVEFGPAVEQLPDGKVSKSPSDGEDQFVPKKRRFE